MDINLKKSINSNAIKAGISQLKKKKEKKKKQQQPQHGFTVCMEFGNCMR